MRDYSPDHELSADRKIRGAEENQNYKQDIYKYLTKKKNI